MAAENENAKKVTISDDCIGCGDCAAHSVEDDDEKIKLFDISSGKSEFIYTGDMTDNVIDAVEAAIDDCPVQAISME